MMKPIIGGLLVLLLALVSTGAFRAPRFCASLTHVRRTKTTLNLEKTSSPKRRLTSREALNLRSGGRARFIHGETGTEERDEGVEASGGEALPQLPPLPTDAVGFSALSEVLNGRLAILGLVVGLLTEFQTGKSIVEQIGLVDGPVLPVLVMVVGLTSAINFEYKKRTARVEG